MCGQGHWGPAVQFIHKLHIGPQASVVLLLAHWFWNFQGGRTSLVECPSSITPVLGSLSSLLWMKAEA